MGTFHTHGGMIIRPVKDFYDKDMESTHPKN
jgi:hypothetical protein